MEAVGIGWEQIAGRMRVVTLTFPVQMLVPSLMVPTFSRSARGVSFYPGKVGVGLGLLLLAASIALGWLLWSQLGVLGTAVSFWVLGTAGAVQLASGGRPMAFVKPICVKCRLLPVITEHEAIHLSGVAGEKAVWASMKLRHSVSSLKLDGDPAICWFCPIPKRLSEH